MFKYLKSIDFLFVFFLLSSIIIYFSFYPLNVDSSWILYASDQILKGKTLYIDIVEVNPPLIFIYSLIPVLLSKILLINYDYSFISLVVVLIFFSIFLSYLILNKAISSIKTVKLYLYMLFFILLIIPITTFGEREHLLVIFLLPYILYSIFKEQIILKKEIQILIVIFASLGLNLKPHFFLIILFMEIVCILHFKRIFFSFRRDIFIFIFSGIIYIFLSYIFFPDFFHFAMPLGMKTYLNLFNKDISTLLINYEFFIALLIFLSFILFTKNNFSFEYKMLISIIFSSFLIYLLQQKGWLYHRIPFFCFSLIFLLFIISKTKNSNIKYYHKIFFIPLVFFNIYYNINSQFLTPELRNIIKSLPNKSSIHILSTDIARGQVILKDSQSWSSRFGALGILPYIITTDDIEIKNYFFNSIYEDLLKYKPDYLISCGKYDTFNYYRYFKQTDKRIKEIYENYYEKTTVDSYIILKKIKEY